MKPKDATDRASVSTPAPAPRLTLTDADAPLVVPAAPAPESGANDLLPNIIPYGSISLLSGAPGLGKTALLATLAKAFRDQTPIFGHQPNPVAGIGIVNADRGWERGGKVWFHRAGFPDIQCYSMPDDPKFDPRSLRKKHERTALFAEFIDKLQLPPGSLLFGDPIGMFLGGNLLDYDGCAVACHEIRAILRQRGLTLIATAHSSKLKADPKERYHRLQDQILGSTALLGFSDTQLVLASPEETGQRFYTFMWASHLAPPETFLLERNSMGIFQLADGTDQGSAGTILAYFPADGGEITAGELGTLALAIPLTLKTVHRALNQLVADGKVEKVRRGTYRRTHALILH